MIHKLSHLHVERPLSALDLETTGLDVAQARIVAIAILRIAPATRPVRFHARVHPGIPIPPEATRVHSLTDADVLDCPPFEAIAPHVLRMLQGSDLCGFNLAGFDLPILVHELARAGHRFDLRGRAVVDVLDIYRRQEPRDLASAVRHYLDREHDRPHDALVDARASLEVLDAQIGPYGLPRTAAELHGSFVEVDVARRFGRDDAGRVVFRSGKHAGRPLAAVAASDPGYLEWMLRQPYLEDVHELVSQALMDRSWPQSVGT